MTLAAPFGARLRHWRRRRGLSQLDLARHAATTPRHVSFLETGRSRPSEGMVVRLSEALDVPLRARNDLLRSAGLPPMYAERGLDDAVLGPYREVIRRLLDQQEPFPAFVLDRRWDAVEVNRGGRWLLPPGPLPQDALAWILDGPLADALLNRDDVLWAIADDLARELERHDEPVLRDKRARIEAALAGRPRPPGPRDAPVVCPILQWGEHQLQTVTTIARFGHPQDVTLDELRVELVFPTNPETEAVLRALGQPSDPGQPPVGERPGQDTSSPRR